MVIHSTTRKLHLPSRRALGMLASVVALHALTLWAISEPIGNARVSPQSLAIIMVLIQPGIRDEGDKPGPNVTALSVLATKPLQAPQLPSALDISVARNHGATVAAPTLASNAHADMTRYIKRAALLPGEGATVVLRIEVLANGEPGRIEIDSSSGSRQIDQAAIAYARTQHWYAGRAGDMPTIMWIRWGVRLQA